VRVEVDTDSGRATVIERIELCEREGGGTR